MLAAGVGALAAVPLSAALIGRSQIGKPTIIAFVACGIPLIIIAGIPLLDTALFFVAAWGVGMAVADVATFSLLHRLLETPLLPRVTGAIESVKLALEGLGALVGPLLASTLGVRWALVLAGLPLPAVVVGGRKLLHRLDTDRERARPCPRPAPRRALSPVPRHGGSRGPGRAANPRERHRRNRYRPAGRRR